MDYIHVRSLEKYHPGYKDRQLSWGKIFINMVSGDPECEALCEIDFSRFVKMILLELRSQKPLPNNDTFWISKGFDIKKRPIELTLQMLHNFVVVVPDDSKTACIREEKIREYKEDKIREEKEVFDFEKIWLLYPPKNRVGKKEAVRHFEASVKSAKDYEDIQISIKNYLLTDPVRKGFVKNASTFFNNWRDFVSITPPDEVDKWRK